MYAPFCSLISYLYPARNRDLLKALSQKRMTAIGMDMIPRTISRAQSFDTLSSQANIAGYRAVIEAGSSLDLHAVHHLCKTSADKRCTVVCVLML